MRRLLTLRDVPAGQRRAMTADETTLFLQLTLVQTEGRDEVLAAADMRRRVDDSDAPFGLKVLVYRLAASAGDLRFSFATTCFLTAISRTAGGAVLWAHYLVQRTRELDGKVLTNNVLADDFPWGFPTEDGQTAIWDAQKVQPGDPPSPTDNCLDAGWAWRETAEASAP